MEKVNKWSFISTLVIVLQAQRPVSHSKPWHGPALRLESLNLVPGFESWTIVELDNHM